MVSFLACLVLASAQGNAQLQGSSREEVGGWTVLHLQGTPQQIGYQYGTLAAPEIADASEMLREYLKKNSSEEWGFFRAAAQKLMWPNLDKEYQEELSGIAEAMTAKGYKFDVWDALAHNGWIELAHYYLPAMRSGKLKKSAAPDMCSAFIAVGSATKDGKIVMGHNTWLPYVIGQRFRFILDIQPQYGHRILMDSWPGFIHSGDDFAINSAGIMLTETTIHAFAGFSIDGVPEFQRMRKAIQYSSSIDGVAQNLRRRNNGGYANTWLIGDARENEIGKLELGLKNVSFVHTKDGSYGSANLPDDETLIKEECERDANIGANLCSDRKLRWAHLLKAEHGKIDAELAKEFISDHVDQRNGSVSPSMSSLCGHGDEDPRPAYHGATTGPNYPIGAISGKVVTSEMAEKMSFWGRMGHPCGKEFIASEFLSKYPRFEYLRPYLKDMRTQPWVILSTK